MSSYFDNLSAAVYQAARQEGDDEVFFGVVVSIESRLRREVRRVIADREFPEDLRQKVEAAFEAQAVCRPPGEPVPEKARQWVIATRSSRLVETMHSLFHELARRRIVTRFGWLSDNPMGIIGRLEQWEDSELRGDG